MRSRRCQTGCARSSADRGRPTAWPLSRSAIPAPVYRRIGWSGSSSRSLPRSMTAWAWDCALRTPSLKRTAARSQRKAVPTAQCFASVCPWPRHSGVTSVSAIVHVVDDDASFRTSIGRLLRACGYAVETYESAEELLTRLPDDPGVSCILLDIKMPGVG